MQSFVEEVKRQSKSLEYGQLLFFILNKGKFKIRRTVIFQTSIGKRNTINK